MRGLTWGDGAQRPASGLLSHRYALHLHGEHSTPAQVRATWRSGSRRKGPCSAPDRSLYAPASEQASRLSDDFARALIAEETVHFVSGLLAAERRRRGTRGRRRALGCYRQAVLLLRWFIDGTRLAQLAADNAIGGSTAYRYLHEGIDVLAAAAPGLRGALLAARAAGHPHVTVDGTLIRTDRCHAPGPTARADRPDRRVDLWWSGKHAAHGGNIQVIAAPDGWPIWTSPVRPGREHDTTALRTHAEVLPLLGEWTDQAHAVLADLGYGGERAALTTPVKNTAGRRLSIDQRTVNLLHAAVRGPAERGNSLLKTTFKALRRVSLCPWRIGAITAAALVLLHHLHGRTT